MPRTSSAYGVHSEKGHLGVPVVVQQVRTQLVSIRMQVQSMALFSGLRIWHCHKMWYKLQKWLRSGVALAVV